MKTPTIKDITALLIHCKTFIGDDYRASDNRDDNAPGMCITIGHTPETGEWDYQSGDNSYSGGAYLHPNWSVIYLYRNSNCRELAREAVNELSEMV